jgi:serine/threonine protein kinase
MSTPDWNELWSLFHRIVTLDQAKRKAALAELPAEQAEELESLLQAHDQDGSLLDRPVLLTQALQPGRLIGPWALQGLIGEGGMGQVWLARRADGAYEKDVAIKLLALGSPTADLARRFARERAILARLDHPNIARLLDGGTLDNGQPYLVMEHVEGQELRAFSQIRALSINQRVELMLKICGAVDHAHRRLIIHRDLKPANILVTRSGQPKLLDFGIARLLHPDADSEQTIAAERRLTLEYASPEQLRGDPVDTRSDAFSLGVILFELLVGQRPWSVEGCSAIEAHSRLTGRPPARLSRMAGSAGHRRQLQGDLDWIVGRAIEPDPDRRYADARELGDDLRRYLEGFPIQARPPSRSYRLGRFVRRHPLGVGSATLALAMMLTAGTLLWQQSRALAVALQAAEQEGLGPFPCRTSSPSCWSKEIPRFIRAIRAPSKRCSPTPLNGSTTNSPISPSSGGVC